MLRWALAVLAALGFGLFGIAPAGAQNVRPADMQGEALWNLHYERPAYLAAGNYEMRAHGTWCLTSVFAAGTEREHFQSDRCGGEYIAVVPKRGGGYTLIPVFPNAERDRMDGAPIPTGCATVARGRVGGTPRLDIWPCESNDPEWDNATPDQWFFLTKVPVHPRISHIVTNLFLVEAKGGCINVTVNNLVRGELAFVASCGLNTNNDPQSSGYYSNNLIEFVYREPLYSAHMIAEARRRGWVDAPDGMRMAVPVRGFDLAGMDYWDGDSADDGGKSCAIKCAGDMYCHAFTWKAPPPGAKISTPDRTGPGAQEKTLGVRARVAPATSEVKAHCWLKSGVPARSENPETASGIVRP